MFLCLPPYDNVIKLKNKISYFLFVTKKKVYNFLSASNKKTPQHNAAEKFFITQRRQ